MRLRGRKIFRTLHHISFTPMMAFGNNLIDIKQYQVLNSNSPIYCSRFAMIYLVENTNTKQKYAAKVLTGANSAEFYERLTAREISILIQLRVMTSVAPTIVSFHGFSPNDFSGNPNPTILMEYKENGSLDQLIDKEQNNQAPHEYDNTIKQIILVGIAHAMMLLHLNQIMHRDLKPANILINSQYHPSLGDFGIAKNVDPSHLNDQSLESCGTLAYIAPEVFTSTQYGYSADVYSFGILMYEVICGQKAYSDEFRKGQVNAITLPFKVIEGLRPKLNDSIPKPFQDLIQRCWAQDPGERPTFYEIFIYLSFSTKDEPLLQKVKKSLQREIKTQTDEYNFQYCLEGVDKEQVIYYIEDITASISMEELKLRATQTKNNEEVITKLNNQVDELKKELEMRNNQNQELEESITKPLNYPESKNKNQAISSQTIPSQPPVISIKEQNQVPDHLVLKKSGQDGNNRTDLEIQQKREKVEAKELPLVKPKNKNDTSDKIQRPGSRKKDKDQNSKPILSATKKVDASVRIPSPRLQKKDRDQNSKSALSPTKKVDASVNTHSPRLQKKDLDQNSRPILSATKKVDASVRIPSPRVQKKDQAQNSKPILSATKKVDASVNTHSPRLQKKDRDQNSKSVLSPTKKPDASTKAFKCFLDHGKSRQIPQSVRRQSPQKHTAISTFQSILQKNKDQQRSKSAQILQHQNNSTEENRHDTKEKNGAIDLPLEQHSNSVQTQNDHNNAPISPSKNGSRINPSSNSPKKEANNHSKRVPPHRNSIKLTKQHPTSFPKKFEKPKKFDQSKYRRTIKMTIRQSDSYSISTITEKTPEPPVSTPTPPKPFGICAIC